MTTTTIDLGPAQHDSLRAAALSQAAENMRHAATYFELAAADPGRVELSDAATQAGIIREDLDALAALGYGEAP